MRLLLPDKESISVEVTKKEVTEIRREMKKLNGKIERKGDTLRFRSGGAMAKMYVGGFVNGKLDSAAR
jgi:hypothetical protein